MEVIRSARSKNKRSFAKRTHTPAPGGKGWSPNTFPQVKTNPENERQTINVDAHVPFLRLIAWSWRVVCYRGTCPLGTQLLCSSQTQHWRRWSSVFSGRVTLQSHDCLKGLKTSGCKTHFPGTPKQTVCGGRSRQMSALLYVMTRLRCLRFTVRRRWMLRDGSGVMKCLAGERYA